MSKRSELLFGMNNLEKRLRKAIEDVNVLKEVVKRSEPSALDVVIARLDDPSSGKVRHVEPLDEGFIRAVERLVEDRTQITSTEAIEGLQWPRGFDRSRHARKIAVSRAMKAIGWEKARDNQRNSDGKRPEYYREPGAIDGRRRPVAAAVVAVVPAIVAAVEVAPQVVPAEAPSEPDLWTEMSENIDPNLRW